MIIKNENGIECTCCGSIKDIRVIYILPLERGGKDIPTNKISICGECFNKCKDEYGW